MAQLPRFDANDATTSSRHQGRKSLDSTSITQLGLAPLMKLSKTETTGESDWTLLRHYETILGCTLRTGLYTPALINSTQACPSH
jgi:hypothetical protein